MKQSATTTKMTGILNVPVAEIMKNTNMTGNTNAHVTKSFVIFFGTKTT